MNNLANDSVYGGIEGGATHSIVALLDASGKILVQMDLPIHTNHWIIGMEECQNRINQIIEKAKKEADLPADKPLAALGLCLSGCENEETNQELLGGLKKRFSSLSKSYSIASDTIGSVLTASDQGGVVLIAGTGSNSLLINPDGSIHRCGGWGYMVGDEGSGYWISMKGVKIVFDEEDSFAPAPYDTTILKKLVFEHFKVKEKSSILDYCYTHFDKSFFALLAKKIGEAAKKDNDELCKYLFEEAGVMMAKHVVALAPNVSEKLVSGDNGLRIVCVGSVFQSWDLLKNGFVRALKCQRVIDSCISTVSMIRLKNSPALGSAYLGAKEQGYKLPLDYDSNCEVFFQFSIK